MDRTRLEQEIAVLEKRLAEAIASKPAHDTTGAYQATLLEIEDELAEMRQALAAIGAPPPGQPPRRAAERRTAGNARE
ncbi:MAG: hypothetical protein AMK72_00720 [Planctomycetes bacterium SM23_25]|jgi:hypothetical protein|nr:MAG: hypothetical protein AMK72_00720 [Planctomycetes bacterium SM23_25]